MADISKISGVDWDDVAKVGGSAKGDILAVGGSSAAAGTTPATRWLAGAATGKIFYTGTGSATEGWMELVDLGHNENKTIAIGGAPAEGVKRWIVYTVQNTNEITYANDADDITVAGNWTAVNFSTNTKAAEGGPGIAWGNDIWVAGGLQVNDGDSYVTMHRSTNGAAAWSLVDEGNTVNDATRSVVYKDGSTWFMGHQSHVWKSTDDGASWTDTVTLEGTKDIYAMAYNGSGLWVAVLQSGNIYTSDDDWGTATERTSGTGYNLLGGVVYAKGSINKWVVAGATGRLLTSPDGVTWTKVWDGDDSSWGTSHIYGIATDHTTVVICGAGGKIATSTDGETFTIRSIAGSPGQSIFSVACDVIGAGMR